MKTRKTYQFNHGNGYSRSGIILIFTMVLSSCAGPGESDIQTAIAQTKTTEPTATIPATYTPYPTYTPNIIVVTATDSPTPEFTLTPSSTPTITLTPTETIPPTSTFTVTPTVTKTKEPGIGVDVKCGEEFLVKILTKPQKETYFYGEKPSGEFWLLKVQISNLMSVTHDLNDVDFNITGTVNGQSVTFASHSDATFEWVYHNWGSLIYPHDEIGPTLTAKLGIAFDINPIAENLRFVWTPRDNMFDDVSDAFCRVSIPIE